MLVANATFYTNADKRKNCRKGRVCRQAPTRRSKTITPLRHAYAKICAVTSPKAGYATPCAMHTQEYPPKRRRTIFRCACYAKGTTANAALRQAQTFFRALRQRTPRKQRKSGTMPLTAPQAKQAYVWRRAAVQRKRTKKERAKSPLVCTKHATVAIFLRQGALHAPRRRRR